LTTWTVCFLAASVVGVSACRSEPAKARASSSFTRDSAAGRYRVDFPKMRAAVDELAGQIIRFQGDSDYPRVTSFMAARGRLSATLQQDLARLGSKGIPVDIVFEQGPEVLR
jgi:hypothetical protein